jgi:AraC-like DNA-binding protein
VSTIYNPGQEYTRSELSADGDRCDWLAVSPGIALAMAARFDPSTHDRADKPFARERAAVDRRLYLSQRHFFARLEQGAMDPLEAEEIIIGYVAAVIRNSYQLQRAAQTLSATEAHRDLAQRARAEIIRSLGMQVTLGELSSKLGVSAFHLCRVFRKETGTTLHAFRLDLRLRIALERLAAGDADISRIALDLGFSSHSHFSALIRRHYGRNPSAIRSLVQPRPRVDLARRNLVGAVKCHYRRQELAHRSDRLGTREHPAGEDSDERCPG